MGITLKAARVNAGFTQPQAAERLSISASTLANYEKGKTYPDYPVIYKMVQLYGVPFDDINFCPRLPLNSNFPTNDRKRIRTRPELMRHEGREHDIHTVTD